MITDIMFSIKNKTLNILSKKVIRNGLWLYTLQIFNTVIPLVTLPYITRILGPSNYGVFSSALNLVIYFQVVVEYGFNLSGARKVALNKDIENISKIYTRISASKIALCLITFIAMIIISIISDIPKIQFINMLVLYTMVVGTAIQQTWVFHGLEDMKFITITSVISRTVSVGLVFLLVKDSSQIFLYSFLYALTYFLMGIISSSLVRVKYNIKLTKITIVDIFDEIKDGWYLFTTSAMSKIFSGIGITVLVFTSTEYDVGIYSAIHKIPLILKMVYAPMGQVIYPYVSRSYTISLENGLQKIKHISKFIVLLFAFISIVLTTNANVIVNFLYGKEYATYSKLLIPLVAWMMLSIINNLMGIQVLVASGHVKEYSRAFRIGVFSIIVLNLLFGVLWGALGVSIAAVSSEFILSLVIAYHIFKIKNNSQKIGG